MGDGRWASTTQLAIGNWQEPVIDDGQRESKNEKRRTSYLRRAFSRTVVRSMISLFDSHQRFSHR